METIKRTISIDASREAVWAALANFQAVGDFHPYITNVDLITANNGGLGSKRKCYFNDGSTIDEEIIDWRVDESYTVDASNFSLPFKSLHGTLGVDTVNGKTEAFMMMEFVPKFGPLGKLMSIMMIKPMMVKRIDNILKGLNHMMVTGELAAKAA